MLYGVSIRPSGKEEEVDWCGAVRWRGSFLDVPARDEERCRERVRLVTERAFKVPLEPLWVMPIPGRFRFRRELGSAFEYLVTSWLVSAERDQDEARARIWEAMDGGLIRVASVRDGPRQYGLRGFCEVEVGVQARCEEQAEVMVRDRLTVACLDHGLEFVPIEGGMGIDLWVEKRVFQSRWQEN